MTKLGSRHLVPLACALVCALALLVLPQVALADSITATFTFSVDGTKTMITANPTSGDGFEVTPATDEAEAFVTINKGGTYEFSGNTSDEGNGAHIIVTATDDVTLYFNEFEIRSKSTAPLSFKTGSKVTLVNESDKPAYIADPSKSDENAAIKVSKNSKCTFQRGAFHVVGSGKNGIKGGAGTSIVFGDNNPESTGPNVTVAAEKGNGISSDGSITFNKGTFMVGTSDKPVGKDGIKSVPDKDEDGAGTVTINGGIFAVYASDDGISAAQKVTITDCKFEGSDNKPGLSADGHAITCAGDVEIAGGEFNHISAGGDGVHADGKVTIGTSGNEKPEMTIVSQDKPGAEGIKAAHVVLQGGTVLISSYDDAISGSDADGKTGLIELKGGQFGLISKVGDALDSNGDLIVTGGTAALFSDGNKDESLIDVLGSFNITGGKIIGLGKSEQTMQLPTNGTYATATLESGAAPGPNTDIHIFKGEEDEAHYVIPTLIYSPTTLFYAGDDIANGDTVQFYEAAGENPPGKLLATATAHTNVGVTSVSLDRSTLQLAAGTSANLKATVKPDNATDKTIIWSTSDDGIATVDANGKVTGITTGTCTVTAKAKSTGVTAQCTVTVTPKTSQMFRLYNPNSGEHFYTSNAGERDAVKAAGWTYEGVAWNAPADGEPVYRLYNEFGGEHHYCTSANERASLIAAGWKDEGIGWYSDTNRGVKILRAYNPNAFANNHNFTADTHEQATLVSLGWKDEGVAWYGAK